MALINCPECGTEISEDAFNCPKCGKQIKTPKRSVFGKVCLWGFYLWNAIMLVWLIGGLNAASNVAATSDAAKAGVAIGAGLGASMIIMLWAFGDIITGLLAFMTRPKR